MSLTHVSVSVSAVVDGDGDVLAPCASTLG
jgi:hypothetical protein